jgi:hypothetical protein
MKKLLGIVVLGLLWCNVGFALTQQQFIDQNLKGRKLDQIEGVWMATSGRVYGFYKSGSQYLNVVITTGRLFRSGETIGSLTKGAENVFYGTEIVGLGNSTCNGTVTYNIFGNSLQVRQSCSGKGSGTFTDQRLWDNWHMER